MKHHKWFYEIRLQEYLGGDAGAIDLEDLYQAFKERLLKELEEEWNNGN